MNETHENNNASIVLWLVTASKLLAMVIIINLIHNTFVYCGRCLLRHLKSLAQLSYTIIEFYYKPFNYNQTAIAKLQKQIIELHSSQSTVATTLTNDDGNGDNVTKNALSNSNKPSNKPYLPSTQISNTISLSLHNSHGKRKSY